MSNRNFDWEKKEVDIKSVLDVIEIYVNAYGHITKQQYDNTLEHYKK